ncbi:DUF4132 domain-containing protein [Treponema zioleckii]|uniref:DUF4132 domain-containing protein n=1 Tax=Treponema zioleckii TaxID=331680 RepID=UPI00168BF54E|nr:DUF4132 domain-containing protein [Treponema zioleckii]
MAQKEFTSETRSALVKKHKQNLIAKAVLTGNRALSLAKIFTEDKIPILTLNDGEKPSESIKRLDLKNFLNVCIPDKTDREKYLLIIDKSNQFQYSQGYCRRSVRSANYAFSFDTDLILLYEYYLFGIYKCSISDYLKNNLDEEKLDLKIHSESYYGGFSLRHLDMMIAAELDWDLAHGGAGELHKTIEDIILGDNNTSVVTVPIIRGIIKSNDTELYTLLGKFLLAARLQEGVRQAICENMDCGTIFAFKTLFDVIEQNDLIRYSSVKRAVATWIGLFNEQAAERISKKTLELMSKCLNMPEQINEMLKSDDAMELMVALWATGFYSAEGALGCISVIISEGRRNQLLVAGYYNAHLHDRRLYSQSAEYVVETHGDDMEVVAAFLPTYLENGYSFGSYWACKDNPSRYYNAPTSQPETWFNGDLEKAKLHADILYKLYLKLGKGKKPKTFENCAFPWNTVSISKEEIANRLCVLAVTIPGSVPKEIAYEMMLNAAYFKTSMMKNLIHVREDSDDRAFALKALSNSDLRRTAAELIDELNLTDEEFTYLESLLHYKDAELRKIVSKLIAERNDADFTTSVNRLLKAKTEDERFAALSFINQLKEGDKELGHKKVDYKQFEEAVKEIKKPSIKESAFIKNIFGDKDDEESASLKPPAPTVEDLYDESKITRIEPSEIKFDTSVIDEIAKCDKKKLLSILKEFDNLVLAHKDDEYKDYLGEDCLLGEKDQYNKAGRMRYTTFATDEIARPIDQYPFADLWMNFYNEHIKSPIVLIQLFLIQTMRKHKNGILKNLLGSSKKEFDEEDAEKVERLEKLLFGKLCFVQPGEFEYSRQGLGNYSDSLFYQVAEALIQTVCEIDFLKKIIQAYYYKILKEGDTKDLWHKIEKNPSYYSWYDGKETFTLSYVQPFNFLKGELNKCKTFYESKNDTKKDSERPVVIINNRYKELGPAEQIESDKDFAEWFKLMYAFALKADYASRTKGAGREKTVYGTVGNALHAEHFFRAYKLGLISLDTVYFGIIKISTLSASLSEKSFFDAEDAELTQIYKRINDTIIINEIRRGEKETSSSAFVESVHTVPGADYLLRIVQGMGKTSFERGLSESSYHYSTNLSRGHCFSRLLVVSKPTENDSAEEMKSLVQKYKIPEQRLYDLAMYLPQWIPLLSEVLGVPSLESGCYYFIAHMKEGWGDHRDASKIAKFTPLTMEELNKGAFDLDWFTEVYAELGEEVFDRLYLSAKYITDGIRHARARRFADAALGRVTQNELEAEINRARNKDLLMSYPLIPICEKGDAFNETILHRYEYLQKFKKESRQFGAQRRQSEGEAVEIALQNLSRSAGYTDVNRLNLNMESALIEKVREVFDWQADSGYEVRINVGESGKPCVEYRKEGSEKLLKSAPAALKKTELNEHVQDVYKRLKQQHERTRAMFENFMTEQVQLPAQEIASLLKNPVVSPIVNALVFITKEGETGLISVSEENIFLTNWDNSQKQIERETELRVAHAWDFYSSKHWHEWQKFIFENKIVQPFKQVFRELYVKLEEELEKNKSLMFAGNQIQPKKAVATLKSRRWIADYESGLQKVFYKQNLIAEIYAQADWFSPADIECPAIEYVYFSPRRYTGIKSEAFKIKDIDDILYSEIMRDVDLAVSVAHAGSVDPETSHSTIEMRRAVCEFTLPLFKIENVRFEKNFAFIKGSRAEYSVHLGTGLVRKTAGSAINIVTVHSQQRGKLFLPFVDEDPKTAEVLSKILMLARDETIKDPYILEQINAGV